MRKHSIAPARTIFVDQRRGLLASSVQEMLSRESSSVLLLLLVLFVEAVVGLVVIRDLRDSDIEVERIYEGSVRGLRRIGELQYEAQETRRCTLYALTTNDGNLQVNYADQSREADRRVTEGIAKYLAQARDSQEVNIAQRLGNDWNSYLTVRDEVLGLILEGGVKDAVDLDLASGVPLFDRVRQDLEEIKRLYDDQASRRLTTVAGFSRRSIIKLTAAVGFCLLFGSIAISAIQRSRMRSTVNLAKLQMDFVASVSHELRTPIAAILSAGENIRDGMVHGEQDVVEQGSIISRQATRLSDLVDQVLLYAATGKDSPWRDVRPLEVSDIVEHALRESETVLREAGFTVEQQLQPGLPKVTGDLSGLSHCLRNLLVNAVKYSGESRWVSISASIDTAASDVSEVQISVRDRGVGIVGTEMAHVFEPFYRSPRVINSQIRGTGLGLSIAKRSAELSGGRLSVESQEGVGSVFTLHLPVFKEIALTSAVEATGRGVER